MTDVERCRVKGCGLPSAHPEDPGIGGCFCYIHLLQHLELADRNRRFTFKYQGGEIGRYEWWLHLERQKELLKDMDRFNRAAKDIPTW